LKLKILYDNKAREGFKEAWGFSCLIESEENILFDTGGDGDLLLYNIEKFNVNPADIDKIVISHDHWDHAGGISRVLNEIDDAEVFVLKSFSEKLKKEISERATLHEVTGKEKISEGVFTTGALGTEIPEQSLFIETENGFVVLTGCSHPGVDNILNFIKKYGNVYRVIGGFHGFSNLKYLKDIPVLSPCHCTTHLNEIKKMYPKNYKECCCGDVFEI